MVAAASAEEDTLRIALARQLGVEGAIAADLGAAQLHCLVVVEHLCPMPLVMPLEHAGAKVWLAVGRTCTGALRHGKVPPIAQASPDGAALRVEARSLLAAAEDTRPGELHNSALIRPLEELLH
jgi:hypothetical protein